MSRKILFKGKRVDNGEWVEGYYVLIGSCHRIYTGEIDINKSFENQYGLYIPEKANYLIDPKTICQYTGLTDNNKKKIWENDIVKTNSGRICKIIWFSSPQYQGWDLIPLEVDNPAPSQFNLWSELEVIGSIFDNSELLEVKQ